MEILRLPVRWYSNETRYAELELEVQRTAFMIVDSDCGSGNEYVRFAHRRPDRSGSRDLRLTVENGIAPALAAAREIGMKVIFIHNDFSLVDEPGSIKREIHGTRWGNPEAATKPPPSKRTPLIPNYSPSIQPLPHEPDFPKREWSGFHETHVDYHLRCYDIKTLIAVGFKE